MNLNFFLCKKFFHFFFFRKYGQIFGRKKHLSENLGKSRNPDKLKKNLGSPSKSGQFQTLTDWRCWGWKNETLFIDWFQKNWSVLIGKRFLEKLKHRNRRNRRNRLFLQIEKKAKNTLLNHGKEGKKCSKLVSIEFHKISTLLWIKKCFLHSHWNSLEQTFLLLKFHQTNFRKILEIFFWWKWNLEKTYFSEIQKIFSLSKFSKILFLVCPEENGWKKILFVFFLAFAKTF